MIRSSIWTSKFLPRYLLGALGCSLFGHGLLAIALLGPWADKIPQAAPRPAVLDVIWVEPIPARVEGRTISESPDPKREPAISHPLATSEPVPAIVPPTQEALPPETISGATRSADQADTQYWALVRAEIARHLRWPGGVARSGLVEVELTLDDAGGLLELRAQLKAGDPRFVTRVERAVRRATPFPPPGPHNRTAQLPVKFINPQPKGK